MTVGISHPLTPRLPSSAAPRGAGYTCCYSWVHSVSPGPLSFFITTTGCLIQKITFYSSCSKKQILSICSSTFLSLDLPSSSQNVMVATLCSMPTGLLKTQHTELQMFQSHYYFHHYNWSLLYATCYIKVLPWSSQQSYALGCYFYPHLLLREVN